MDIYSNVDKVEGLETNPHGFMDPNYVTERLNAITNSPKSCGLSHGKNETSHTRKQIPSRLCLQIWKEKLLSLE